MTVNINVLLTAAGRRVPLIKAFKKALTTSKGVRGTVVCVDMEALSAGLFIADRHYLVPEAAHPQYVPALLKICKQERITMLIPTTDEELAVLASQTALFLACGTRIIVSPPQTIQVCNDKLATYQFFKGHNIPTPTTYLPEELAAHAPPDFPLFLKPRGGKGSINTFKANNQAELDHYLQICPQPLVQQFIEGKEYTVDVLCDLKGQCLCVVPRERLATQGGVSQKGRTESNVLLETQVLNICSHLQICGPANIQFIQNETGPYCIEINPRFSGGIPLTLAAGADFPAMLIELSQGNQLTPALDGFQKGLIMLRYDESIFVKEGPDGYVPYNPV